LFQSLLSPDLYDLLFPRNTSGDKGERFAFPQSFRSLRCVSARWISGISISCLGDGKKEGQPYKRLALCKFFVDSLIEKENLFLL